MNFVKEAVRTESDKFYPENIDKSAFLDVLDRLILHGNELDLIKKSLFYNKPAEHMGSFDGGETLQDLENIVPRRIVHGILGKVTEGIEMLEALRKAYEEDSEFDLVNLLEEVGDDQWYTAILSDASGVPIEQIQATVIAKLRKRFPDRFTEYDAQNRDLEAERKILDAGMTEGLI